MSDAPDAERPATPADDAPGDMADETPHISSLRPVTRAFSMRRLLNVASLALAGVLLLALAIHWLPSILPGQVGLQPVRTNTGPVPPAGWRLIGPDWAQDIAFSADGSLGYICGATGLGDTPVLVARFAMSALRTNTWRHTTNPATGIHCQIAVSPVNADDVALSVDDCQVPTVGNCAESIPISRIFRSHDAGASWSQIPLPAPLAIYGIAWVNSTLFLQVWGRLDDDSAPAPSHNSAKTSAHLLVSQDDGPLTEIGAQQLVGHAAQFDYMSLFSSGETLYVAANTMPCSGYCLSVVHTNDNGDHWTGYSARYANRPITPSFAQPASAALIGWVFQQSDQKLALLRSRDYGAHWGLLPELPRNPSTGGVTVFAAPDGALYVASYGATKVMYELPAGAGAWRTIGPMPSGMPLAVQYDASGRAVALWGQARDWAYGDAPPGLEYYPLTAKG